MGRMPLPAESSRRAIAAAVHRAVTEFDGSDGFGKCFLYALAGQALAREVTGRDYLLQAGALKVLAYPPDGWLVMNPRDDGLDRGEFHCWFALAGGRGELAEVVDLASLHHRRWADSSGVVRPGSTDPVRWAWPWDPPPFVWSGPPFPDWMGLMADAPTTAAARARALRLGPKLHKLHWLARKYLR